jgi:mRNA-degrading endonuclease RelE of RelBE toxin-antitoxin system
MSYKVIPTPQFEKEVKKLSKKYPSAKGCYFGLTMPIISVKRYQIVGFPMLFKTTKNY